MANSLTKEQEKTLLLLTDSKWASLQKTMKNHYKLGSCIPLAYGFLVALTNEQWQTVDLVLTKLRVKHEDVLNLMRKKVRSEQNKTKKSEYMREYMQRYRRKVRCKHGQGSNQDSS